MMTYRIPPSSPSKFTYLAAVILLTVPVAAIGEPPARPIGALIFEDSFERERLGDSWRIHPRSFTIADGLLVGAQQAGTKQGGVVETDLKFGDASLQFSFKFEGSSKFSFVVKDRNHQRSKKICRLEITPEAIKLQDDKSVAMVGKSLEARKEAEEKSVKVAAADLKEGTWHTIILDIAGPVMKVRLDGKEIATLESQGIAHKTKTDIGFSVTGSAVHFDNIKAWKVSADKSEEATEEKAR